MINSDVDRSRKRVVKVREGNLVLGSDLLSNDDLVDVVELVPILVEGLHVLRDQNAKARSADNETRQDERLWTHSEEG